MDVTIAVRVTPRASRDAIEGADAEGLLRARVRAAPVDGAANLALRRLIADALGVPASAVELVRGPNARRKVVRLVGVAPDIVVARWPGIRTVR